MFKTKLGGGKLNKKTIYGLVGGLTIVALAIFVYAWAYDTDGGFNVWEQGTCYDDFGNHTDSCSMFGKVPQQLNEYHPYNVTNQTNQTYCKRTVVSCVQYNATCQAGRCVPN